MVTPVITSRARRTVIGGALATLVAVVVGVSVLGGSGSVTSADDLPEQSFELFDGGETTLADFRGTPLVINFWASWCPACVGELPEFQTVHQDLGDEVQFLGLANADQRGPAVDLANEVGLTYTLGDDPQGDLFREFGLIAMPSTIFVNGDGEIVEVFAGQLNESALSERVEELIGQS